jgi:adenosine kinase
MKIAVSGSMAYDRIMDFPGFFKDHILPDKIHSLNLSFCVSTLREGYGGTAGNIAYNLKLLGLEPLIFSQVGNDFHKYRDWLIKNRIETKYIKLYPDELTAGAYIITDQNNNQITGFHPGAMRKKCDFNFRAIKQAKFFLVAPGNNEDMMTAIDVAKKLKIPFIFDFGQQITTQSKKMLLHGVNGAFAVIANDYEISLMLKKTGLTKNQILGKIKLLVTTLGPRGSVFETSRKKIRIPAAKPKNTSDPTGAGDAFRAGLLKGLVKNYSLEKTGRLAALVSVYTVEKYGTQTHKFKQTELSKRYLINFKEKL